jgi:hypothetical protein
MIVANWAFGQGAVEVLTFVEDEVAVDVVVVAKPTISVYLQWTGVI